MTKATQQQYLKPIQDLLDRQFFIPSYQRGYRWTERQVTDLLEDINEFRSEPVKDKNGKDTQTFYCLQPIVVKKRDDDRYEVIDGQQRLTTIFMIIHYANEMWVGKQKIPEFQIEYETRGQSFDFLQSLETNANNSINIDDSNIDFYHMSKAYESIHKWVNDQNSFDESGFQSKFRYHTKIIWYEIQPEENKIDAFTRLNMGKIPLTSAELIKSLFLNSQNFEENEKEIKQIEIAKEWDEMEQTLQNNEFWYFLTTKKPYPSRIELIFEIISGEQNTQDDKFVIYRWFQKKKDNESIVKLWSESKYDNIKKVFLTLKHWFEDRKLYHLIGFLITIDTKDTNVQTIYNKSKNETKTDFLKWLYEEIKEQIQYEKYPIDKLEYGQNSTQIQNTLLLFNMATLLNENSSYLRFAFDKYRQEKWSLEHIHPQSDVDILKGQRQKWLEQAEKAIITISDEEKKEEPLEKIREFLDGKNQDDFDELKREILELFGDESSDGIKNLTLLKKEDNSSLSNHLFPTKREKIIAKDKNGSFIPICTKNVFLKYYSTNIQNLYFWSENDREDYLQAIKDTLESFLNRS